LIKGCHAPAACAKPAAKGEAALSIQRPQQPGQLPQRASSVVAAAEDTATPALAAGRKGFRLRAATQTPDDAAATAPHW
jgi:hypothetical protein